MSPEQTCRLCGMALGPHSARYSEGLFCDDSAGCRRRALKLMEELRARTDQELERRLLELAPQVEKAWVEVARLIKELADLALTDRRPAPSEPPA